MKDIAHVGSRYVCVLGGGGEVLYIFGEGAVLVIKCISVTEVCVSKGGVLLRWFES